MERNTTSTPKSLAKKSIKIKYIGAYSHNNIPSIKNHPLKITPLYKVPFCSL
jgi:hypothetical protein